MKPTHAMILAAGYGSRLNADEGHKILAEIGGRPLLDYHLDNFERLGVQHITVVAGYNYEALKERLDAWPLPSTMTLETVCNKSFDLSNGLSVLTGVEAGAQTPFWLVMGDHLFEPSIFDALNNEDVDSWSRYYEGMLAVDYKLDTIFDMPDANKISISDGKLAIDKNLMRFEMVDIGLFWCGQGFVDALKAECQIRGDCTTSDAVKRLTAKMKFLLWDVGQGLWQDVDTPGARRHAEQLVQRWGDTK